MITVWNTFAVVHFSGDGDLAVRDLFFLKSDVNLVFHKQTSNGGLASFCLPVSHQVSYSSYVML